MLPEFKSVGETGKKRRLKKGKRKKRRKGKILPI
jgi:hypothetical protein